MQMCLCIMKGKKMKKKSFFYTLVKKAIKQIPLSSYVKIKTL